MVLPANSPGHEDRREAGVHQHGTSTLNIALDGRTLVLELEGPAMNFLGFEHAPRTPEQTARLDSTLAALRSPAGLFTLPPTAGCALTRTEVTPPRFGEGSGSDHQHQHGHDHHDDDIAGHSELAATWEFTCVNPTALANVEVRLFPAFPGTERIVTAVVTPSLQTRAVLTPGQTMIRLR